MSVRVPRVRGLTQPTTQGEGEPRTRRCGLCSYTFTHTSLTERENVLHSHYMRWHWLDHERACGIL